MNSLDSAALTPELGKHLLRRWAFAATPDLQAAIANKSVHQAVDLLLAQNIAAPLPSTPDFIPDTWVNPALRLTTTSLAELDENSARASAQSKRLARQVEQAWLKELLETAAPMRENMTLFFHGAFGGSYRVIGAGKALWLHLERLRRHALGRIPDLLESLVLDPAMMIQYEYDESRRELPSLRAANRILDYWLVGEGNYSHNDAEQLARALTGWVLQAPPGVTAPVNVDPRGSRNNRRTGLHVAFHPEYFDQREKTILGLTGRFDAPAAVRALAMHPLCATHYASLLIDYFGVEDANGRLRKALTDTYLTSRGDVQALLREMAAADEFWSDASRWRLVKSPVHLAVGAHRAIGLAAEDLSGLSDWLKASGQTLFDSPSRGEQRWPTDIGWLEPAGRLAARYQLGDAVFGRQIAWGVRTAEKPSAQNVAEIPAWIEELAGLDNGAIAMEVVLERLDPAPGLETDQLENLLDSQQDTASVITAVQHVVSSAAYQLA